MLPFIAAIAQFGSSMIGAMQASEEANRAARMIKEAYDEYLKLGNPPEMAATLAQKELTAAGILTPELEEELNLGVSKLQGITPDQELLGTRKAALSKLMGLSETGLSPIERAQAQELQAQVAGDERARQQSILEKRQARGIAGGGDELASALISSQGAANRQSQAASNINAQAYARALEALGRGTSLAGELQREDLGLQEKKATAADEIARFNTANSVERGRRNTQRLNEAQATNLAEKQRIQDTNTSIYNREQARKREGAMQDWKNMTELAKLKANAKLGLGNEARRSSEETAQNWQKIGTGTAGIIDEFGKMNPTETQKQTDAPVFSSTVKDDNSLDWFKNYRFGES